MVLVVHRHERQRLHIGVSEQVWLEVCRERLTMAKEGGGAGRGLFLVVTGGDEASGADGTRY